MNFWLYLYLEMSKATKKLKSIQNRLEKLCCPYLEDGSEQWVAELLLHPSETRSKLLTWIISSFDSDLEEILSNTLPVINSRIDSRHQKLLFVLNLMGICKIDDLEFVRGTASQKRQIVLWDDLVDMLYTSQNGHPYTVEECPLESNDTSYYLKPAKAPSLAEMFHSSCTFIDTLVREQKMQDLFSTEVHLFSPDLEGKIKEELKTQDTPSIELLLKTAEKVSEDISMVSKQLKGSLSKFVPVEPDQNIVENYCRKIDLSLKTFSQMIDSYIHCHDNDIETWCTNKKPELSTIGPCIKTVSNMFQVPDRLNQALKTMNTTTAYVTNTLPQQLRNNKHSNKVCDVASLRETASVLQESLQRKKEGF